MPGWLPRAFALALALVGAYQLLSWAFLRTLGLLLNVLIAFFLALAMEPAVAGLARRGMRRGAATALVSLVLLLAAAGFFYALGSLFAEQVSRLAENFPRYVTEVVRWSNQHFHTDLDVDELRTGSCTRTGCAVICATGPRTCGVPPRRCWAASSSC
ncbi:AI-2E family transporter [Streptomyces albus]